MSADFLFQSIVRRSGLPFLAFLLSIMTVSGQETRTWESFINIFPFPQTSYENTPAREILRDIERTVREQVTEIDLPPLSFVLQSDPDLDRPLTLTVPELSAGFAMSFVIRQANLGSELIRNDLFIFPAPSREAGMRSLEIELSAREILFLNLERSPKELEPDVFELARDTLLSTRVFRTGPNAVDTIPVEFAALALLLRAPEPAVFLEDVLKSEHPAGQLYAQAGLNHLDVATQIPSTEKGVPVVRSGERRILVADAKDLYEAYVSSGTLLKAVLKHTANQ